MSDGRFARRRRAEHGAPLHLPLPAGPVSNGEFVPSPRSSHDRDVDALVRDRIDAAARRLNVDRRRFLQGAGAVAVSLAAFELAACGGPSATRGPRSTTSSPGGTFRLPPPEDTAACRQALSSGGEFIFDVHTHHVVPDGPWVRNAPETVGLVLGMLPAGCTDDPVSTAWTGLRISTTCSWPATPPSPC